MTPRRYCVSLQLAHPQADLAPVFAALALVPSHLHRRGEPRRGVDGAPARGHYRASAGTALLSPPCGPDGCPPEPLDACLARALEALSAHAPLLRGCAAEGGRARIAVRLPDAACGAWTPPAWLADRLDTLGLDLAIDAAAGISAPTSRCLSP